MLGGAKNPRFFERDAEYPLFFGNSSFFSHYLPFPVQKYFQDVPAQPWKIIQLPLELGYFVQLWHNIWLLYLWRIGRSVSLSIKVLKVYEIFWYHWLSVITRLNVTDFQCLQCIRHIVNSMSKESEDIFLIIFYNKSWFLWTNMAMLNIYVKDLFLQSDQ